MTRATSIAVYRDIEASGALSRLRLLVAKDIAENGPTTQAESCRRLMQGRQSMHRDSHTPRFSELENADVIEVVDTRICSVTGRECIAYDLTGRMPVKVGRRPTKVEEERRACAGIALAFANDPQLPIGGMGRIIANVIANRIRARGEKKNADR